MGETDYEKLKMSLDNLQEQYAVYATIDDLNLPAVIQKSVRNSVIKCFEVCYDTLWKHLKKFMLEEENLVDVPNSPQGIFRRAHESGVIDQETEKRLIDYNKIRALVAHDYRMEKAGKALGIMGDFIQDAGELYERLTERR